MKKIILSMLALTLTYGSFAQSKNHTDKEHKEAKQHKGEGRKNMADKVDLSDAQKAQMKTINETFRTKMHSLKQDSDVSDDVKKQRKEALMKEHREQMQAVLTPEQRTQWEQNKKEHAAHWKGDKKNKRNNNHNEVTRGKGTRGQQFGEMSEDLNLSAEQTARMKTINESFRTNMQRVRKNESLTQEQKKEQVKELQNKHRADINSMLTTEQREKFNSTYKNRNKSNRFTK